MLSILGSQLAFSAATTLAKKTFEFSITSSLKGLSDVIRERFQHSKALQDTQAELETKVRMLCLPIDILAHHVTQGNTALQEPLGVALGVLEDIEAFRQALVAADVARAQDAASPDATASAAQLCRRLKELVARLDSVLPYLTLAISTVALLERHQGAASPLSPSRLLSASWHLRSAAQPGAPVFTLPEAAWHEERQLSASGPPRMAEVLRLCRLTVARSPAPDAPDGAPPAEQPPPMPGAYELLLEQDLAHDGLYHEPDEAPLTMRLQVADILGLEWQTTQSLHQGENEYRPALVLHVLPSPAAPAGGEAAASSSATKQPSTPALSGGMAAASSRSRSRLGTDTAERAAAAGRSLSPTKTPVSARPSPPAGGLAGGIRRCAIMLSARHAHEGGSERGEGSQAGSGGGSGGEENEEAASSEEGDEEEAAGRASRASSLPPLAAPLGGGLLQREWQLLGELEYVLRLCILESREQVEHQDVTDERIQMVFQATSVVSQAVAAAGATPAPHPSFHAVAAAAAASSALQRGSSATARLRTAAAGAAAAMRDGVEAATHSLRQLSFSPAAGAAAEAAGSASAGGSAPRRTSARTGGRGGGRSGFGSPVQ